MSRQTSSWWVAIEMGCAMPRGMMGCSVVQDASGDERHMMKGMSLMRRAWSSARGSRRKAGTVDVQAPSISLRAWPSRPGEIARHGWALGMAQGGSRDPQG